MCIERLTSYLRVEQSTVAVCAKVDLVQEVPGSIPNTASADKCTGGKQVLQRAF